MEAKKLTLQDIHIGDYVQEFSEITKNFSMPMYVDGIFGDGDLYLNFEGNEADPWDAKIKDVFDIPIDWGILPHFGFVETDHHVWVKECGDWLIRVDVFRPHTSFIVNVAVTYLGKGKNKGKTLLSDGHINSIRELQHFFYEKTDKPLKLNFE